jgi:hypothetical protein
MHSPEPTPRPESLQKEWSPLRFENGRYVTLKGNEVVPDWSLEPGSGEHHRSVFIEYERTFGRGEAKYVTHSSEDELPGQVQVYGKGFLNEYKQLAGEYHEAATRSMPEEARRYIERLQAYRRNHPGLYRDAE